MTKKRTDFMSLLSEGCARRPSEVPKNFRGVQDEYLRQELRDFDLRLALIERIVMRAWERGEL